MEGACGVVTRSELIEIQGCLRDAGIRRMNKYDPAAIDSKWHGGLGYATETDSN
jgi:hypothetical protein